ncbi:ACT domain-containing protein [Alicyclobacillus sp. TC]|uniref:ACT domain-containing protein n=1 Tax=Alicyclobacillus sp. TC TaxID=2606450 RepID=UPI001EE42AF7|nr:ACT domain-containing protein [Alicyclobacillus sp. TC]
MQKRVVPDEMLYQHYVRFSVSDKPGVFARIAQLFGDAGISMETVLQKRVEQGQAEIVVVTHSIPAHRMDELCDALAQVQQVQKVACVMPLEALSE